MIKFFETYSNIGGGRIESGDKVMVKYKPSKYFMKTGKVLYAQTDGEGKGDLRVMFDYNNDIETFYYTNLVKIVELVEMPSGEVLNVPYGDVMELATTGLIEYNKIKNYYFFDEDDRWQIESFAL